MLMHEAIAAPVNGKLPIINKTRTHKKEKYFSVA
jgi:hypothetical protein